MVKLHKSRFPDLSVINKVHFVRKIYKVFSKKVIAKYFFLYHYIASAVRCIKRKIWRKHK